MSIRPQDGWTAVSYAFPISNDDGKQDSQYVQVDLCVTKNMKFKVWGSWSDVDRALQDGETQTDANPKSGVRNALFTAIARGGHAKVLKTGAVKGEGDNVPVDMIRYDYDYRSGLYKTHRRRKTKKDGSYAKQWEVEREFVTDDPDEIVQFLYNDQTLTSDDVKTTRDAWDALIDSDMWSDQDTRAEIGRCYEVVNKIQPTWDSPSWIRFD